MSTLSLARPSADEAAPFYNGYIAKVRSERIGEQLLGQLVDLDTLVAPLDDIAACARYAAGKWSVKEVLGHLTDTERIFSYRLLRVARGDATPLPGFDENAYVPAGRFDGRPLGSILAELRAVRLSTAELAEGLVPEAWTRWGQASGAAISTRALAYIIVGHLAHHMAVLRERYGLGTRSGAGANIR